MAVARFDQIPVPIFALDVASTTGVSEDAELLQLFAPVRHITFDDLRTRGPGQPAAWKGLTFYTRRSHSSSFEYHLIRVVSVRTDTRGSSHWDKPPMTMEEQLFEAAVTDPKQPVRLYFAFGNEQRMVRIIALRPKAAQ